MLTKVKKRVFEIIELSKTGDKLSHIFDLLIIILICINVITIIAGTFNLPENIKLISKYIEIISIIIFTFEYIARIWTADYLYPRMKPYIARIKYIFSFMAIIDLLAILPFYLPMVISIDLRILRVLRMIRLFRIFKINRYTSALSTIVKVFKNKAPQLISSMLIVSLMMIIASVLMYNFEHEAQPETFSNVFQALWWSIATLTTVGYGDIYPVTAVGKILSAIIAILGIGLVAVPTGIITSGFSELVEGQKDKEKIKHYCPYCGNKID